ncbi:hypothetical protein BOX15_Mlig009372g1 [Macrostomum lignano]|uniref:F-box domain-containing protein n=2 Tax=Macrostomum lignano TaxID=282301 RepID=A0A267F1V0_9PLAT|nr:hypothetical protein BOX15_Mlig001944g1 [Macrostomum lignano]PAA87637.1 hypothetical protein BOX15_Mlig009372g1 [Macrostomum lignano]
MQSLQSRWELLPHNVLQQVLSLLPNTDARNFGIVCYNWRRASYTVKRIWRSAYVDFAQDCYENHHASLHQFDKFMSLKAVQHLTVHFNSHCEGCIESLYEIATTCALVNSDGLQSFSLRPSNSGLQLATSEWSSCDTMQRLCRSLLSLICHSHQLRHLSLGLTDCFDGWQNKLLHHLQQHECLKSLHLASLRSDPISSRVPFIDNRLLRCFRLTRLSLDLNQVSEELVASLARGGLLRHLSLFVHNDVTSSMPALAIRSWAALGEIGCEASVTMLHSPSAMQHFRSILPADLPLTRLRMYFCQRLPPTLFDFVCARHSHRLRCLRLVESMNDIGCCCRQTLPWSRGRPDPLMMIAWMCPRLEELAVYGYCVSAHTIVGLAALRGPELLKLEVPERCLYRDTGEGGDSAVGADPYGKVSHWLGYRWCPIPDSQLPGAMLDSDFPWPEEAYIESLLNDQDYDFNVGSSE